MSRVFAAAVAAYRLAVRAVAGSMPSGSTYELVAVFDALQHDAFRERGWRGLGRAWLAEAWSLARIRQQSRVSAPGDPGARRSGWSLPARRDVRDAVRSLRRSPGYAAVVLAMFALGIGVNTAVFSLVDALLFKALPYAGADRLVLVAEWPKGGGNWTVAPTMFSFWRRSVQTMALEARMPERVALVADGEAEELAGARVTPGYFDLLGVSGVRGRTFSPADGDPAAACVVVITNRVWQRELGADAAAMGRPLYLNGESCALIGVLPAHSVFDRGVADVYTPLALSPSEAESNGRMLTVLGRLRGGASVAQATAEVAGLAASFNRTRGQSGINWTAQVFPWRDIIVRTDARQLVWILFAAVAAVLTIACANVAGLSLSRTMLRRRELAVRAALGAGRARLVWTLVTESLVLSIGGGAIALVVGALSLRALIALVPPGTLPAEVAPSLDGRTLLFTSVASILTGVVAGLLPAWQAGRLRVTAALGSTGRGFTASRGTSWMQSGLLVAELALAMVLVTSSALLAMSLVKLTGVSPGFDASGVLTLRLPAPASRYPTDSAIGQLFTRARSALTALPFVESAGGVTSLPLGGWLYGSRFVVLGATAPDRPPSAHLQSVTPGYFEALKIAAAAGRTFTDADDARAPKVAIVNETLARRFVPDGRVLGRVLQLTPAASATDPTWDIVGVIHDVKTGGLADAELATPEIYVPVEQAAAPVLFFAIRTTLADPTRIVPDVRAAIRRLDPDLPVGAVMTMEERVGSSLLAQRFRAAVIGAFAGLASLLACLGAYTVRSRAVASRTREMGIRLALGATRGRVIRTSLAQGATLAAVGLGVGLAASGAVAGYLRPWLYSTEPADPLVIGAAIVALGGAALAASWVPARRAGTVDPLTVLRDS